MDKPHSGEVAGLLVSRSGGNKHALDLVLPLLYGEVWRIGRLLRREQPGHTLQPTALVHEVYLRLIDQSHIRSTTRAQFFAIASNRMRQILVNYAAGHEGS